MLVLKCRSAVACVAVAVWGCSEGSSGTADASVDGHVVGNPTPEAAVEAGGPDASLLLTTLRLAHLAPDTGRVDLCYRPSNSEKFVGPLLSQTVVGPDDGGAPEGASDGGSAEAGAPDSSQPDASVAPGIGYPDVSAYRTVAGAGTFDVAVVPAGTGSCTGPIVEARVTLDAGKHSTLAFMGLSDAPDGSAGAARLAAFTDELSVDMVSTSTRFVHAALGTLSVAPVGALTVSATASSTTGLAAAVAPGMASTPSEAPPLVDVLGYHPDVLLPSQLALRLAVPGDSGAAAWATAPSALGLDMPSVHTGFLVTYGQSGLAVLWCLDTHAGRVTPPCVLLPTSGP